MMSHMMTSDDVTMSTSSTAKPSATTTKPSATTTTTTTTTTPTKLDDVWSFYVKVGKPIENLGVYRRNLNKLLWQGQFNVCLEEGRTEDAIGVLCSVLSQLDIIDTAKVRDASVTTPEMRARLIKAIPKCWLNTKSWYAKPLTTLSSKAKAELSADEKRRINMSNKRIKEMAEGVVMVNLQVLWHMYSIIVTKTKLFEGSSLSVEGFRAWWSGLCKCRLSDGTEFDLSNTVPSRALMEKVIKSLNTSGSVHTVFVTPEVPASMSRTSNEHAMAFYSGKVMDPCDAVHVDNMETVSTGLEAVQGMIASKVNDFMEENEEELASISGDGEDAEDGEEEDGKSDKDDSKSTASGSSGAKADVVTKAQLAQKAVEVWESSLRPKLMDAFEEMENMKCFDKLSKVSGDKVFNTIDDIRNVVKEEIKKVGGEAGVEDMTREEALDWVLYTGVWLCVVMIGQCGKSGHHGDGLIPLSSYKTDEVKSLLVQAQFMAHWVVMDVEDVWAVVRKDECPACGYHSMVTCLKNYNSEEELAKLADKRKSARDMAKNNQQAMKQLKAVGLASPSKRRAVGGNSDGSAPVKAKEVKPEASVKLSTDPFAPVKAETPAPAPAPAVGKKRSFEDSWSGMASLEY
jgi:hypothetical protein